MSHHYCFVAEIITTAILIVSSHQQQVLTTPTVSSSFLTAQEIADLRLAFPLCLVDMPEDTIQQPIVKISVNVTEISRPGERLQVSLDSARLGVLFNSVFITAQYIDPTTDRRVYGKIDCGRGRWLSDNRRPFTPAVTTCEAAETMPPASGAVLQSGRNSLTSIRFLWDAPEASDITATGQSDVNTDENEENEEQNKQKSSVFQFISFLVVVWQSDARMKWVLAWRTPAIRILYMPQGLPSSSGADGLPTTAPSNETLNLFSKLLGLENCLMQPSTNDFSAATTSRSQQVISTIVDLSDLKTGGLFSMSSTKSSINLPGERVTVTIVPSMGNLTMENVVLATAVVVARRGMPPYLKGVEGSWVPSDTSETVLCNGYIAIRTKSTSSRSTPQSFTATWLAPAIIREKIFVINAVVSSGGTVYKLAPLAIIGPNAAVSTATLTGDGLTSFLSSLRSICAPGELPPTSAPSPDWPTATFGQLPFKIEAVPSFVRNDIISGSKAASAFNISVVGLSDSDNFRFIFIQCRSSDPATTTPQSFVSDSGRAVTGRRAHQQFQHQPYSYFRRRQQTTSRQAHRTGSIGYWRSADQPSMKLRNGPCIDSALVTDDSGTGMHSAAFQLHLLPTTQGDLICRLILGKDNATYWSTEYPLYRSVHETGEGSSTEVFTQTTLRTTVTTTTRKPADQQTVAAMEAVKCLLPPALLAGFGESALNEMLGPNTANNPYSMSVDPTEFVATDHYARVKIKSSDPSRPIAAVLVFAMWMSSDDGKIIGNSSFPPAGFIQLDSSSSNSLSSFLGDAVVQCNHKGYGRINGIATVLPGLTQVDALYYTPSVWELPDAFLNSTDVQPVVMAGVFGDGKLWRLDSTPLWLRLQTTTQPQTTTALPTTTVATARSTTTRAKVTTPTKPTKPSTTAVPSTLMARTTTSVASDIGLPYNFVREAALCLLPSSLGGIANAFTFEPRTSPNNPFKLSVQPSDGFVTFGSDANVTIASSDEMRPIYAYLLFAVWLTPSPLNFSVWNAVPTNKTPAGIFTPGQETMSFIGSNPELTRVRCSSSKYGDITGLASLAPNLQSVSAQWFAPFSLPSNNDTSSLRPALFAGVFSDQKLWELNPVFMTLQEPIETTTHRPAPTVEAQVTVRTTQAGQPQRTTAGPSQRTTAGPSRPQTTVPPQFTVFTATTTTTTTTTVAAPTTTKGRAQTTVPVTTTRQPPTTTRASVTTAKPTTLTPKTPAATTTARTTTLKPVITTRGVVNLTSTTATTTTIATPSTDTGLPIVFDCRRHNHDCKLTGGYCDTDTGKCRCSNYYSAYDCRALTALIRDDAACNEGRGCGRGQKYGDYCLATGKNREGAAEFAQCSCSYGYYGPDCNRSRIELGCSETDMTITVNPFPSFSVFEGHIFLVNKSNDIMIDDDVCRFNMSDMSYQFAIPYETLVKRCGGERIGDNAFAIRFVIQNHPHWLTAYDQILSAKCILTVMQPYEKSIVIQTNGNVRLYSGANALSNLPENVIVGEHTRIIPRPVPQPNLTLKRVFYDANFGNYSVAPVTGPVKIGDTVMFSIENSNSTVYTAMRTEDCTLTMDNSIEMKLIAKGCPASRAAWTLLRWDKTVATNSSVSFWLRLPANALSGWPRQIDIYCRVKLCLEDSADQCAVLNKGCRGTGNFLPPSIGLKHTGRHRRELPAALPEMSDDAHLKTGEDDDTKTPVVYATVHYSFQLDVDENGKRVPSSNVESAVVDSVDDKADISSSDHSLQPKNNNNHYPMVSANADALRQWIEGDDDSSDVFGDGRLSSKSPSTSSLLLPSLLDGDLLSSKITLSQGDTNSLAAGLINQWLLIGLLLVVFLLIASAGLIFYLSYRLRHSQAYTLSTAG